MKANIPWQCKPRRVLIGYNLPQNCFSAFLIGCGLSSFYGHWGLIFCRKSSPVEIVESLCIGLQCSLGIIKIICFVLMEHKCRRLLEETLSHCCLESNGIFTKGFPIANELRVLINKTMKNFWEEAKVQTIVYASICVTVMSSYVFKAFFVNLYHQLIRTPNYEHILPFPAYYPIWSDKGMSFPYYYIQLILSSISIYICGIASIFPDVFFVAMCLYIIGLLKCLKIMIEHNKSTLLAANQRLEYMHHCAMLYQNIFELVVRVDQIFKHIVAIQFLFSLLIQGCVVFSLSLSLKDDIREIMRLVLYIAATATQSMLFCYNAQRLTTANEEVSEALYDTEWYSYPKEFQFLILMMIMRTIRPLHFQLSAFAIMSHETLMAFFKTSGSYFLLLQNVMDD